MTEDDGPPARIRINHDDYHASHVGTLSDGRQFFMTQPFVPAVGRERGREFIAVYLFDADGAFLEARIDDLGPRKSVDEAAARALFVKRFAELGEASFGPVEVAPFEVERFGISFGLIPQPPEEEDEDWCVIAEPGNVMAFYPPWDGDYDT